eukprot:gene44594-60402_t
MRDPAYNVAMDVPHDEIGPPAAPGVLGNDSDPEGDPLKVTSIDVTGTQGAAQMQAGDLLNRNHIRRQQVN